jgi:hypothetical protein
VTLPVWSNTTPLSLGNIQAEFGGTGNIGLSEYYAGGLYVTAGTTGSYQGVTTPIPSSGNIAIGNFYGASASGGSGGGTTSTTTTTAGPGTTSTTTTTTTTAAVPLELIFQTTGTSRFTPGSYLKTNLSTGALAVGSYGGGAGPYWVADQSQSYNGVYRTSILSPGAGFDGPATYADPAGALDGINHYFEENQSTRITAAPYPGGAKKVKSIVITGTTDPETSTTTNGYILENWGHAAGGDTAYSVDQRFTTTNNVNCRIAGTPYVFLGIHYGNNTTQVAIGTKLGEVGLNTDLAIKIRLYDPVNNTLLATHNTWIPAPNAPGFGFASSGGVVNADTANVCWQVTSAGSPSDWTRTNFVDVGDPGNNTGAGDWGVFKSRTQSGLPTKLVITLGH